MIIVVGMDEGITEYVVGPFDNEEEAQDYITNLEDTFPAQYEQCDDWFHANMLTPAEMLHHAMKLAAARKISTTG